MSSFNAEHRNPLDELADEITIVKSNIYRRLLNGKVKY